MLAGDEGARTLSHRIRMSCRRRVELRLGQRVIELGIEQRAAELESGERVSWDVLCIATGSSAPAATRSQPSRLRLPASYY